MKSHVRQIATALSIAAVTLPAQAQLQISCPVDWSQIFNLDRLDADALVLGVKVRDWKPEHFDEMARRHEECMDISNYPESLKKAERTATQETLNQRGDYLKRRDANIQRNDARLRTRQAVEIASKNGVEISLSESGVPLEIQIRRRYPDSSTNSDSPWWCSKTGVEKTNWIDDESIKKIAYYTNVCWLSGSVTQQAALRQKENLESLMRLYVDIPKFAFRVSEATKSAGTDKDTVADLNRTWRQIVETAERVAVWPDQHPQVKQTEQVLQVLREKVEKKTCDTTFARAMFPETSKTAYFLADVNTPEAYPAFICKAMSDGAQVRYLAGGLTSNDGFEVKGKSRTVQVFVESRRIPGGDPKALLLTPVSAKIDGQKIAITRQNYRSFQAELITAIMNK